MGEVVGVWVKVATAPGTYTGSDDHVYLGICGTEGGREFSLDVDGFDDWEPDSKVAYGFGPEGNFDPGDYGPVREPTNAADQLEDITISQPDITHVYLRKQGDRTPKGDDYWELSECSVHIISDDRDDPTRAFFLPGTVKLGNEFGHKVWLE